MPRYFFGDELGNVKALRWQHPHVGTSGRIENEVTTLSKSPGTRSVQALAVTSAHRHDKLLAAAYSDGSCSCFAFNADQSLNVIHGWQEQLPAGQKYIGLAVTNRGIYSCTTGGALRLMPLPNQDASATSRATSIASRLCDWRLSPNEETFAYGGYEVDLSLWNTEKAFTIDISEYVTQKGRSKSALLPAETWRAKNVPNDALGLRKPVRITSLTLCPSHSAHQPQILAGTQFGDIRLYDTRAARRPVANWEGVCKSGGVYRVEMGFTQHDAFVSGNESSLLALDLRNGRIAYTYKDIAGTVTSMAHSSGLLASVSFDRFARIHSTFPLPTEPGKQQEKRGQVIEKFYVQTTPTVIVWDEVADSIRGEQEAENDDDEDDDVWNLMEDAGHESGSRSVTGQGKRKKRRVG